MDESRRKSLLNIVEQCMEQDDLTEWEGEFLDSLEIRLTNGQDLTARQIEVLNKIDER